MTLDEQKASLEARKKELGALMGKYDHYAPGRIENEDPRIGRALQSVAKGNQAHVVYEFLKEYLSGRQQALDHQLFEAPEEEWASIVRTKREVHLLVRNLTASIEAGQGSARILQPMMELRSE